MFRTQKARRNLSVAGAFIGTILVIAFCVGMVFNPMLMLVVFLVTALLGAIIVAGAALFDAFKYEIIPEAKRWINKGETK